jgi:hypothetical protein
VYRDITFCVKAAVAAFLYQRASDTESTIEFAVAPSGQTVDIHVGSWATPEDRTGHGVMGNPAQCDSAIDVVSKIHKSSSPWS